VSFSASALIKLWRPSIEAYLNAFFDAIERDERFYLPVVATPNARLFVDAAGKRPATDCCCACCRSSAGRRTRER